MIENVPVVLAIDFLTLPGGRAKSDTALAPFCHAVITTKFGEFLHNGLGDNMTDQQTDRTNRGNYNISLFFVVVCFVLLKQHGDNEYLIALGLSL